MTPPAGRYVVVAPHPDDEVLTVGGLIGRLITIGAEVIVVSVTDGGNAYPQLVGHDELAARRRREQERSLDRLGVAPGHRRFLSIRDGSIASQEDALVHALTELLEPTTTIVAPWTHDVHTDHEAVGRAAERAALQSGCTLWYSLFWAWHADDLDAFDDVDLIAVELNADERNSKAEALCCHESQLAVNGGEPVLSPSALGPAEWTVEYFVLGARPS